jgi:hypothetical protein
MPGGTPLIPQVIVLGDAVAERELYFIGDRAVDLRPAWLDISGYLQDITKEQFATEGARGGSAWPELNNKYAFSKWNRGERLEILRASDAMYKELTGGTGWENAFEFFDERMEFGSSTPEFRYQQGNEGMGDMPIRQPIVLTDQDVRIISGKIMDRIIFGSGIKQNFSRAASGRTYYSRRDNLGRFA